MGEQMRAQDPGIFGLDMKYQAAVPDVVVVAEDG
jgi:hypothetical protein